jgi:hypothetical protein
MAQPEQIYAVAWLTSEAIKLDSRFETEWNRDYTLRENSQTGCNRGYTPGKHNQLQ